MSVVNECRKGDLIYNIIEGWSQQNIADPNNIVDEERKFEVGDELEFIDANVDDTQKGKPCEWQVIAKCKDGYVSKAAQFFYVTEDEWNDLKKYFKEYYKKNNNEMQPLVR